MTAPLTVRTSSLALLALLLGLACTAGDPEPTYLPENGVWSYAIVSEDTNTCSADLSAELEMNQPMTNFFVDYDLGDSFQIELGAEDVTCVIEAERFDCSEFEVYNDGTFRVALSWAGSLSSSTQMSGKETWSVTCLPDQDCSVLGTVPCARSLNFDAEYAE